MNANTAKKLLERLLPDARNEISVKLIITKTTRRKLHGLMDLNFDRKCILEIDSYNAVIDKSLKNDWGEGEIIEVTVILNPSSISLLADAAIMEDVICLVPEPKSSLYNFYDGFSEETHGEKFNQFVSGLGDPLGEILEDFGIRVVVSFTMKTDSDIPGIDSIMFTLVDREGEQRESHGTLTLDCFAGTIIINGVNKDKYIGGEQIDTLILAMVDDLTAPTASSAFTIKMAAEA